MTKKQYKASILLVEDEENLHEALKLNLELEGYEVTSAFDGNAAMQAVHKGYYAARIRWH
jgi:two-component system, OmpR family, alkaline phosphatase synthesis response regulator PhoP